MRTKLLILSAAAVLAAPAAAGASGSSTALFLRQETSARMTGMGGAAAALYDDPGAVYLNPAGLGFAERHGASITAWKGLDDKSRETFISGVYQAGSAGALSLTYLGSDSGNEEIYDLNGNPSDITLASEYALGAAWGFKGGRDLAFGAQAKYVRSELAEAYTARTLTLDLGVLARTPGGMFSAGAGVQNFAGRLKYLDVHEQLARVVYVGAAARFDTPAGKLVAAVDIKKPRDQEALDQHAGLQLSFADALALRAGARRVGRANGFTLGGGVAFNSLAFDYSFEPAGDRLNQQTHKFTLSLAFGPARGSKAAAPGPAQAAPPAPEPASAAQAPAVERPSGTVQPVPQPEPVPAPAPQPAPAQAQPPSQPI